MTIDGRRRTITKREAIVTQMVDKSASADLRATKMLIGMMNDVEHKAGDTSPPPEPRRLAAADKEVVQQLVARLQRQILQEMEEAKAAEPRGLPPKPASRKQITCLDESSRGLHIAVSLSEKRPASSV